MWSWHFLVLSEHCQHKWENTKKNCKGTRVLVPGHQNSGALSSWQLVFYCNLENGHQNYQFVFFPKGIYEFFAFSGNIRILPAKLRIHNKENTKKINVSTPSRKLWKKMWGHQSSGARAPELWCPLCSWLLADAWVLFQAQKMCLDVILWYQLNRRLNWKSSVCLGNPSKTTNGYPPYFIAWGTR